MYVFGVYMCVCLGYVYVCLERCVWGGVCVCVEYVYLECVCVRACACVFLFGVAVFGRMRLMASL